MLKWLAVSTFFKLKKINNWTEMININKYNLFSPKQIGKESENMYSVQSRYEFENRII